MCRRLACLLLLFTPVPSFAQSCPDIAGTWTVNQAVDTTLTLDGESDTLSAAGTSDVTLVQSGCAISYSQAVTGLDGTSQNVSRTGTLTGNQLEITGKALIGFPDGACDDNRMLGLGTVFEDRIEMTLSADVTCADDESALHVVVDGEATFTGNSVTSPGAPASGSGDDRDSLSQNAVSTDGRSYAIASTMSLGVRDDDGRAVDASVASVDHSVDFSASFTVDPVQVGRAADFFVALRVGGSLYMVDGDGNRLSWNGSAKSLVPRAGNVTLNASHQLAIDFGKFTTPGKYAFYAGYKLRGESVFHITGKAITLDLAASASSGGFPEPPGPLEPEVRPFYLDLLKTFSILDEDEHYDQKFFLYDDDYAENGIWAFSLVRRYGDETANYIDVFDLADPTDILRSRDKPGCYLDGGLPADKADFLEPSLEEHLVIGSFRGVGRDYLGEPTIALTLEPILARKVADLDAGRAFITLTTEDHYDRTCDGYEEEVLYGYERGGPDTGLNAAFTAPFLGTFENESSLCSTCEHNPEDKNFLVVTDGQHYGNDRYLFRVYEHVSDYYGNGNLVGHISSENQPELEYPLVTNTYQPFSGDFFLGFGTFIKRWYWFGREYTPLIRNSAALITDNIVNYVAFHEDLAEPVIFRQVRLSDNQQENVVETTRLGSMLVIGTNLATYLVDPGLGDAVDYIYEAAPYYQKIDKPGLNLQLVTHNELGIPVGPGVTVNPDNVYLMIGDEDSITLYSPGTSSETGNPGSFIPRYEVDIRDRIDGQWRFHNGFLYDQTHDGFAVYAVSFE